MKMKNIILAAAMLFLSACGSSDGSDKSESTSSSSSASPYGLTPNNNNGKREINEDVDTKTQDRIITGFVEDFKIYKDTLTDKFYEIENMYNKGDYTIEEKISYWFASFRENTNSFTNKKSVALILIDDFAVLDSKTINSSLAEIRSEAFEFYVLSFNASFSDIDYSLYLKTYSETEDVFNTAFDTLFVEISDVGIIKDCSTLIIPSC